MRIRDAVHGFIHYDDDEEKIIDSPPFQRLRNIKQLSFCHYVYPGAMHSRFEHSLGVMELATRVFDHFDSPLHEDRQLLEDNFKKGEISKEEARKLLRLTALLHDIGHLPFSHGGEGILPDGKSHEDISATIITAEPLASMIGGERSRLVAMLIGKEELMPQLKFLRQIISGQFDADRTDYLIRDSHHCGVDYGNFDYRRLIETLRLKPLGKGGIELAIERGGVHALEALILARYFMFTQVYCHRVRRIYDVYLGHYLNEWKQKVGFDVTPEEVINHDDITVFNEMKTDANTNVWAERIVGRRHHKLFFETSDYFSRIEQEKAQKAKEILQNEFPSVELIEDLVNEPIHKFTTGDDDDLYEEDLTVICKDGKEKSLYEEANILKRFKGFRFYRIYADHENREIKSAENKMEKLMER